MNSIPLNKRLAKLSDQLNSTDERDELTSGLVRQAAKVVVEQLLEVEVNEQLGRQRYERRGPEAAENAPPAAGIGAHMPSSRTRVIVEREQCIGYLPRRRQREEVAAGRPVRFRHLVGCSRARRCARRSSDACRAVRGRPPGA